MKNLVKTTVLIEMKSFGKIEKVLATFPPTNSNFLDLFFVKFWNIFSGTFGKNRILPDP